MTKVAAGITISLDGYITGPNDGPGRGLGDGGERLHYWVDLMPRWVGLCYHTPFVDRFAHAWMWRRGGWEVLPPPGWSG